MSVTPDRLTQALQTAIRDSGLSLNMLAERTGLDDGQLSRFMRNDRTISLRAAAKLCAVLGVELKSVAKTTRKGKGKS